MMLMPNRFDEVSAEWLTSVLALRYPDVEVTSCERGDMQQTKHNKIRAVVQYNRAGCEQSLPTSLIVKSSFPGENPFVKPGKADHALDTGNWLEVMSYAEILPLLNANHPRALAAHWDVERRNGFIVMEDLTLKGVRFCDPFKTLNYAQAVAFIDSLARINAPFWESAEFREGGRFGPSSPIVERGRTLREALFKHLFTLGAKSAEEQHRESGGTLVSKDHLLPRVLHDKPRQVEAAKRALEICDQLSQCIIHGDEHLRNYYIERDGRPGFLDWACRIEGWPISISYFLINSLDPLDRREWEKPLLAHYIHRLKAHGARAPSMDDVWFGYRCGAIYPLSVWANNRESWQPGVTNAACTVRAATAVIDLQTFQALGV